eukprot:Nitzschia sp. Nitz4//scaffold21_size171442//89251//90363//NITZ4_002169-RA/size171442-processed-gene-0.17-mRNA-1//1//CDS//3329542435//6504//frame0
MCSQGESHFTRRSRGHTAGTRVAVRRQLKDKDVVVNEPSLTAPPTASPTNSPPTASPTVSLQPTGPAWTTQVEGDGSITSTCTETPSTSLLESSFVTEIQYSYALFLYDNYTSTDAEEVAAIVESQAHSYLVDIALTCNYESMDLTIFRLTSSGSAGLSVSDTCEESVSVSIEGATCWKVEATANATIYSTLTDSQFLVSFTSWLDEALLSTIDGVSVLGIELQGFSNQNVEGGEVLAGSEVTSDTGSATAAAVSGNIPVDGENSTPGARLVLGLAASAMVVVSVYLIRRRKRRQQAYQDQVEKLEEQPTPEFSEEMEDVEILNDASISLETRGSSKDVLPERPHNSNTCLLQNCPQCLAECHPTFVPMK